MTRCRFLFFVLILVLGLSSQAAASYPLIVQIPPTVSIDTLAATLGGTVADSIPGANTYLLVVPVVPLPDRASLLGIQWMELNRSVSLPRFGLRGVLGLPGAAAPDWYKLQPAMRLINAARASPWSTGRGVVVADINSKVDYAHAALVGHLTSGYDFVSSSPGEPSLLDQSDAGFLDQSDAGFLDQSDAGFLDQSDAGFLDRSNPAYLDGLHPAYSHGSLSAGIIAAIAPDSMIMPLRVFGDDGQSDLFTLAKAIRYAVDHGAQVIQMNFGILNPSLAVKTAVDFARASNVLLVAPAGNDNTSRPRYPAAFDGVMTAASTDLSDTKGLFSNYASYVFVSAPGVDVISVYPGGYYIVASGTSLSAAALAGTAALVRSLRTNGVPDSIAQAALNIDSQNPTYANQLGHGRIDVLGSVMPQGIPVIAEVKPATGTQGQTLAITVTGRYTHFAQDTTQLSAGSGVTITNIVVDSSTLLTAQVSIADNAAIGAQTWTATTSTEVVTLNDAFTIIAKADQTIVFGALPDKTYGNPPFAVSATGGGSTHRVVFTASGACTMSGNIVTITGAGTCTVTASQAGDVNYNPARAVSQTFTINKAPASVMPGAGGKTYGSSDPVLTGTLNGFLPSDNVTAFFARTAGEAVGTYTISAALGPASVLSNYHITYNIASFVIAPLPASVTPNPASKMFGDDDPSLLTTGTLTGFLAGDNVTATYSRNAGDAPGQYTISATLSPATVLGNYTITYNTANFTIKKYSFSTCDANGHCVGGKPNDNGIGGRLTITSMARYGHNATATVTVSPAAVNTKDALTSPGVDNSNQPLPPVFKVWLAPAGDPTHPVLFGIGTATKMGPDHSGNYTWQTSITAPLDELLITPGNYTAYVYGDDGSSLTNNQVQSDAGYSNADTTDFIYPTLTASLTVTGWSTTTSINAPAVTYNTAAIVTVTVTSASGTLAGNLLSLTVDSGTPTSAALSNGSAVFTINGLNAGDHSLTASYAAHGNFAASSSTGTLHVNPRPITVTADAQSKTYGDADPALSYQITSGSLVNGDSFTGSLTRLAGNNVGTYAVQPGTLSLSTNYTLLFAGANLTINPKSASVTPGAGAKTYGSSDPVLTGTLSGFLPSDNVTAIFARTAGEAVGTYTISAALGPASVLSNYDITYNIASFVIAPLPASPTP